MCLSCWRAISSNDIDLMSRASYLLPMLLVIVLMIGPSGLLAFALACAALWHKIRIEKRWLMREFGDQYGEYRRASWMLVPYLL